MKAAIAHYHLRPGGVTNVIESACAALLAGGKTETQIVADGIGYCIGPDAEDGEALAARLRRAAPDADLWHFHNPTLGKHQTLPDALGALAGAGVPLLLQIHDFAEDNRPSNYRVATAAQTLYPPAHYAAINSRDHRILSDAGASDAFLHLLPNPVPLAADPPPPPHNERPLVLYPVRGIRRKNLGEVALLSAVARRATFAIAAPPDNPLWLPIYNEWRAFCAELELPVVFGVVDAASPKELGVGGEIGRSLADWLAAADAIVTTSVAEGFGLAFLESAARGRPLFGRDLPEITTDFFNRGVSFSGLYQTLTIPASWVGTSRLKQARESGLTELVVAHGRRGTELPVEDSPERIDFADLDEAMQRDVIRRVLSDQPSAAEIRVQTGTLSADLPAWLDGRFSDHAAEIAHNRAAIARHYSLPRYAERLTRIYEAVLGDRPASVEIDREKVLDAFLSPERFRFLLTT